MVATDSARSASPYNADMPMQPRPRAETWGPAVPRVRVCVVFSMRSTMA
ncbi:hypothetical protein RKD18_003032 [Streptomyces phaeoluteigriseus]